jgi:hypothetical protein
MLKTLDIKVNTKLSTLYCNENELETLDVKSNTDLTKLWCYNNQLTTLDLNTNTSLTELRCHDNQIESLDLSENSGLTILHCSDNRLIALNIKNGNNDNLTDFDAINNPELDCIQVDNSVAALANTNWLIDETASYSEDCTTGIGISEFSQDLSIYPNPVNNYLHLDFSSQTPSSIFDIEIYNTGGLLTLKKVGYCGKCILNLENFQPGIYFVHISIPEKGWKKTFKIIKQAKML